MIYYIVTAVVFLIIGFVLGTLAETRARYLDFKEKHGLRNNPPKKRGGCPDHC